MDYISLIKAPIEKELSDFIELFNDSLTTSEGLLSHALDHIKSRSGKRMRPILMLLIAKNFGIVNDATLNAAVGLELLHTASLVHDDVVDESNERRGQASVNATYNNKVAVLVGDYILSTALLKVSFTHSEIIVQHLAELGRTLSNGEILQLSNIQRNMISEEVYYSVINQKTAALFEACAGIGALSVNASEDRVEALEFKAKSSTKVAAIPLAQLNLKDDLQIICIGRRGKIILPAGTDCIMPDDRVVVVTKHKGLSDLDDILSRR